MSHMDGENYTPYLALRPRYQDNNFDGNRDMHNG